jgi:ankyrin repeat protein
MGRAEVLRERIRHEQRLLERLQTANIRLADAQLERLWAIKSAHELGFDSGNTALHLAAARGSDEVIQLLADRGAKPDVMNKLGQTPLSMAATHKRTADLLRKLGEGFDLMK